MRLPLHTVDIFNESSRSYNEGKDGTRGNLFQPVDINRGEDFKDGWRNKLIWGDNLLAIEALLEKFAGKVDLIYIDPPFATGLDFLLNTEIGNLRDSGARNKAVIKHRAYGDSWKRNGHGNELDGWLNMMLPRIRLMRDLLSDSGSIYVHVDYRISAHLRIKMDEIFGEKYFRGWIVWQMGTGSKGHQQWSNQHNDLLCYSKGSSFKFNYKSPDLREPFSELSKSMHFKNVDKDGRRYRRDIVNGKSYIYYADEGRLVGSVWTDCPSMAANSPILGESVGYPTQKPEKMLRRVISASSNPGDLVADFFCGSGTTLAVAEKLGRRWIGCDIGRWAIHVSRKRLLSLDNCKPFETLSLGKFERQYWSGVQFGKDNLQSKEICG